MDNKQGEKAPSFQAMAREAFSRSVGTRPLKDLVVRASSIAVIVDDGTRPTPVADILKVLLPDLRNNGRSRQNVTIVVALGTHVPMQREGLEARLGKDVVENYTIVQHNAWQTDLVPVEGPCGDGVVKINPEVARADVKIGISSVLPHPSAGYGGGPKILMPGVCNFEFIRDHHMKYTIHPRSRAGLTEGNPFHQACIRIAQAIGLDFSINCVYNQQGQVVGIIAGSLEMAFAKAVEVCFQQLGHRFEEKVDVAITSTYPHTHGQQFVKRLSAPHVITKETGAILMVAPLVQPVPDAFISSFKVVKERSHNNAVAFATKAMSQGLPFLPEEPLEFNMAMSCMILRPAIRIILVSPLVKKGEAETMGLEYASSLEEGLKLLETTYPQAAVAIFPAGGLIVPITAW